MSSQMALFHLFLWQNSISLCIYTTYSLSNHLWKDTHTHTRGPAGSLRVPKPMPAISVSQEWACLSIPAMLNRLSGGCSPWKTLGWILLRAKAAMDFLLKQLGAWVNCAPWT